LKPEKLLNCIYCSDFCQSSQPINPESRQGVGLYENKVKVGSCVNIADVQNKCLKVIKIL